jgi:glycosyltransferase involved in cell wall biosynthesis
MVKVNFDVSSLTSENLTGIGVYARNLVRSMAQLSGVACTGTYRISRFKRRGIIGRHAQVPLHVYVPGIAGLFPHQYQVFHGTDFRVPLACPRKKVVTIHDLLVFQEGLSEEKFAREGRAKLAHALRSGRPDHVIVISEFTRSAFTAHFPEWASRVSVVYLGIDHLPVPGERTAAPYPFPYLFYVGTVEKRKNVDRIVEAFGQIAPKYPDLRAVIVGGKGWGAEDTLRRIAGSPFRERILYRGFVSNAELVGLYRHARFVAYPSLYEGFGIPILEAMRMGCPVITSNIGAMREVSGAAALHADPYRTESIAAAMVSLLEDDALRGRLVAAGHDRVRTFTWRQCALNTLDVYKKFL